ncbi:MAG: hypothetical protein IJU45_06805, partial [Clostridia bacterium]|nr:hypothetical protein [Clostridia bacterium]
MKKNKLNRVTNTPTAIMAAVTAALLTGMMWRLRGDHGFGGSFGMYAVLTILLLFIILVYPRKNKANLPFVTLTALAGAVTAGGWGTINHQITGVLTETGKFPGAEEVGSIAVSPLSGLVTMLLLGFGWLPLFGMMLGMYFSDRKYNFFNALEGTAVFYAARYLFKFTAAPALYRLICPGAVDLFNDGLKAYGIDTTPQSLLFKCLGDQSKKIAGTVNGEAIKIKIKEIPGGRNFFTCCAVLAAAFGALVLIVYFAARFRDKKGAKIMALICSAMAVSITAADVLILFGSFDNAPQALVQNSWSFWEYGTGFLFGLMSVLLLLPFAKQKVKNNAVLFEIKGMPQFLKKAIHVAAFFCTFCLSPILVVYSRIDVMSEKAVLPAAIAAAVIGIALTVILAVRNKKTLSPLGKPPAQAVDTALPILFAVYLLLYFFIG